MSAASDVAKRAPVAADACSRLPQRRYAIRRRRSPANVALPPACGFCLERQQQVSDENHREQRHGKPSDRPWHRRQSG